MLTSSEPSVSFYLFARVTSKVTDHRSPQKCNNNGKVWNIARITKLWHGDTKWAKAVGETGLPQTYELSKWKKVFIVKKQYLWRAIKWG